MKLWHKVLIVTLIFGIPAFLTGHMIWPPDPMSPAPTAAQLPFFMFLGVMESLVFGLGVSFIIFGYPLVKRIAPENRAFGWLVFIAISWLLVSWWPHDNLHTHNGMNLQGLLYIEYLFHGTLMIVGLILGLAFLRVVTGKKNPLSEKVVTKK